MRVVSSLDGPGREATGAAGSTGSAGFGSSISWMRRAEARTAAGSYSKTWPRRSSSWERSALISSCNSRSTARSDACRCASAEPVTVAGTWPVAWAVACSSAWASSWLRACASSASRVAAVARAASRSRRVRSITIIPATAAHSAKISAIFSALAEFVNSMTTVPMTASTNGTTTQRFPELLFGLRSALWSVMSFTLAGLLSL